jgi:hypothetical protein
MVMAAKVMAAMVMPAKVDGCDGGWLRWWASVMNAAQTCELR